MQIFFFTCKLDFLPQFLSLSKLYLSLSSFKIVDLIVISFITFIPLNVHAIAFTVFCKIADLDHKKVVMENQHKNVF